MGFHRRKICRAAAITLLVLTLSFSFLAASYYSKLKETFLDALSKKASDFAGQKVSIGDISYIPPGEIILKGVIVGNPVNFGPGDLLRLKKLVLDISLKELLDRRLHFREILVSSPELTLMRNEEGKLNISDKLMSPGESDITYRIDEMRIVSGGFGFRGNAASIIKDIDLSLTDISSEKDAVTHLKGSVSYSGNRVRLAGWLHLRDEPKEFSFSLSGDNMKLPSRKLAAGEFINTEKVRIDLNAEAKGDLTTGFRLSSRAEIRSPGLSFFKKPPKGMRIDGDFVVRLKEKTVSIENLTLRTGEVMSAQMTGLVKNLESGPDYQAEIRIESIDLSELSFMKGTKLDGILSSDPLKLHGNFRGNSPSISGNFHIAGGSIRTGAADLNDLNATVNLSSHENLVAKVEASASLAGAGSFALDNPARISLSGTLKGGSEKFAVSGSLSMAAFETHIDEKKAGAENLHLAIDGALKGRQFSGGVTVDSDGLYYAGYGVEALRGSFVLDFSKDALDFRDIHLDGGGISSSAKTLKVVMPGKKGLAIIEATALGFVYPEKDAEVEQANLILRINRNGSADAEGDVEFSAERVAIEGLDFNGVSGNGIFTGEDFDVRLRQAEFGGGKVRLSARGRLPSAPFPVEIDLSAENIQLQALSEKLPVLSEEDYQVKGDIRKLSFTGAVESKVSLSGSMVIDSKNIDVIKKDIHRNVIGNASFHTEVKFRGTDLSFKAETSSGELSVKISGEAKDFLTANRTIDATGNIPRVEAAACRETFWGVFPDSLLYAGLDGYLSSVFELGYRRDRIKLVGTLNIEDFFLTGENGEYSLGPVHGALPFSYSEPAEPGKPAEVPSFDLSHLEELLRQYSDTDKEKDFHRISAGTFRYGFRILEDIDILVKQSGDALNVGRFSATIFGGKLYGSAIIGLSGGLNYRAGFLVKALSLARLTEEIEPIRGYISGKVDGVGTLKGKGTGIMNIIGMANFRTYSAGGEKTVISREFLKELGGKSMKVYAKDRAYDKGDMSIYIDEGDVIFQELEISNKNFLGIRDLSIKVAPFSNRISIDNLLWSLTEAAARAKEKK